MTIEDLKRQHMEDTLKLAKLDNRLRYKLCDSGFYNEVIEAYMVLAMTNAGLSKTDINKARMGLYTALDDSSAEEA